MTEDLKMKIGWKEWIVRPDRKIAKLKAKRPWCGKRVGSPKKP